MFGLGTTELIIIGVIIFIIFGAKRIPDIGKGLGGALREFRKIKKDISPQEPKKAVQDKKKQKEPKDPPALKNKLAEKVVQQIPGVRQAVDVKRKVDKVKKIMD
ncbi:MAG: twin-arginine translocase TatA/TatE family subunit [Desulfobacteraceae bacterium]|jgi:sec-independent protein translocase protein TatA